MEAENKTANVKVESESMNAPVSAAVNTSAELEDEEDGDEAVDFEKKPSSGSAPQLIPAKKKPKRRRY